jgi:hypothetical protein
MVLECIHNAPELHMTALDLYNQRHPGGFGVRDEDSTDDEGAGVETAEDPPVVEAAQAGQDAGVARRTGHGAGAPVDNDPVSGTHEE